MAYLSVLKFILYLRGTQCILCCDHKPLEPILSCTMKIPKLNCWSLELSDYNLMFIHIKGSNNILADAISRLMTLEMYTDPLEYPKTSDTMTCVAEVVTTDIQNLGINKQCLEQKKDIHCRNFAAQSHCMNKNSFNAVMISPDGLLQKQNIHGLKYNVIIAPCSTMPLILQEFHNSKGHQGTICIFEAKLHQDIVKHINRCNNYA